MYKVFITAKNILHVGEILSQLDVWHYGFNITVRILSLDWVTIISPAMDQNDAEAFAYRIGMLKTDALVEVVLA